MAAMDEALRVELEAVLAGLLDRTGAGRTTVRVDWPARGLSVNTPVAEALAPGMASMMGDGSIDHRRAATVRWLEANRRTLVQEDVLAAGPLSPPPALSAVFGTRAQMVAPVIAEDDYLVGWVSAHFPGEPRRFGEEDVAAMEAAVAAVKRVLAPLIARP